MRSYASGGGLPLPCLAFSDEFSFLTNNDLVSFSCFCVFSAAGFFGFFWNIGVLKVFVKVISDVCLLATS